MVYTRGNVESQTRNAAEDEDRHETAATIAALAKGLNSTDCSVPTAAQPNRTDNSHETLFSTIGFGVWIDTSHQNCLEDATEAAIKAVRDAMERVVHFPAAVENLQLHLKLGIPAKQQNNEVMNVDTQRIISLLPRHVPLRPIEIVNGGLATKAGSSLVCAAVACITLEHYQQLIVHASKSVSSPKSVRDSPVAVPTSWEDVERQMNAASNEMAVLRSDQEKSFHRSTSIDVLAHISAEMHEQQPKQLLDEDSKEDDDKNTSYKKLPPGFTPKNNVRLFVKHKYRDHSTEKPRTEDLDVNNQGANNTTFPVKLHETLSRIEEDGLSYIIGWMPHGRSFKIFEQQEFCELILPKYFVMTKKSSFLRQLNLYGFNRLSGVGPDQGSYYHEKFLKGMKFLARRIRRQKINGNGIRAAGNPDDEPNLSSYPACPVTNIGSTQLLSPTMLTEQPVPLISWKSQARSRPAPASSTREEPEDRQSSRANTSQPVSFPLKLQRILDKLEAEGCNDIICWLPHGRAFLVLNPQRFVDEIMPLYFNQSKYSSFQRQLHMYNFQRINYHNNDKGAYHHPSFLRGKPQLAMTLKRTRVNGKGTRKPGNPELEPDFYAMETIPSIVPGTKIEIPVDHEARSGDDLSGSTSEDEC